MIVVTNYTKKEEDENTAMALDESDRIPEISLSGAYIKIRDYLQQNVDRFQADENIPNETIATINGLNSVEKATVSEMLNVMCEVRQGKLE
jgi:hypothetical protein